LSENWNAIMISLEYGRPQVLACFRGETSMSRIGRESRDSDKLLARSDLIYVGTSRECRKRIKVASVRSGTTPRLSWVFSR